MEEVPPPAAAPPVSLEAPLVDLPVSLAPEAPDIPLAPDEEVPLVPLVPEDEVPGEVAELPLLMPVSLLLPVAPV